MIVYILTQRPRYCHVQVLPHNIPDVPDTVIQRPRTSQILSHNLQVQCLCVCVCVCVRERERERECVCVCVYTHGHNYSLAQILPIAEYSQSL